MPIRLQREDLQNYLQSQKSQATLRASAGASSREKFHRVDVLIAGTGPIACGYARTILEKSSNKNLRVLMVDIGSKDNSIVGAHHKNSIKYQKDIDAFVNIIKGALQPVSIPSTETYIPTLGGNAWSPGPEDVLTFHGSNPNQIPRLNLKASAVTRTVGGMATHWTCACPIPHAEERVNNPIPKFDCYLAKAHKLLGVHPDQYDDSIRHNIVKKALLDALKGNDSKNPNPREVQSLPLAVQRRKDNPDYVTWTGADTVLGDAIKDTRLDIWSEARVTYVDSDELDPKKIVAAKIRRLDTNDDVFVVAQAFVIACGAVGTPQILLNSKGLSARMPAAVGTHLSEQSLAFCQIVLKREIIDSINDNPVWKPRVTAHHETYPKDPLPIPFNDPEPQVMIPYTSAFPYHCQIHRDAFSYGDVGPRADPRVIVDLRFFGKQDINPDNRVIFGKPDKKHQNASLDYNHWLPGVTDIYGLPQPTFEVRKSLEDERREHKMMSDMTAVANALGGFLPGSTPQFMDPGLALHMTGTTRIGTDPKTSVADASSKVHNFDNLWVGGNGCIPDSTACNPTLTSLAIAIKGAEAVVEYLKNA